MYRRRQLPGMHQDSHTRHHWLVAIPKHDKGHKKQKKIGTSGARTAHEMSTPAPASPSRTKGSCCDQQSHADHRAHTPTSNATYSIAAADATDTAAHPRQLQPVLIHMSATHHTKMRRCANLSRCATARTYQDQPCRSETNPHTSPNRPPSAQRQFLPQPSLLASVHADSSQEG
jgi:hypothetical protein